MRIKSLNLNIQNFCYPGDKKISFKRSVEEHKSWGAKVDDKTKNVSFKIFAYPDTDKVDLTIFKKNNPKKMQVYTLQNRGNGIFESDPSMNIKAKVGDKYFYTLTRNDKLYFVKDPYSFKQDRIFGPSTIYDHSEYKWGDDYWFKFDKRRISRIANKDNGLTPLNASRIYEMHIGTISKEGTFEGAKKTLKRIKDLGFNSIEIMPLEGTYSFNWGYDGVDKFAPSSHLGGPDGFKSFVDYAHNIGLNVIIDMVPNHIGPEGNQLGKTGPYISSNKNTPFGDKFNYNEENSLYVRDFMVNASLNWLHNYHCDGIRFDLTSDMASDSTMKQIAAEINYHKPDAFLIAEDGRVYDERIIKPLLDSEIGKKSLLDHEIAIDNISQNKCDMNNLGFDSRWDFELYHTLRSCLEDNVNLDAIEHLLYNSPKKVKFLMSHDEIGNHEGTRIIPKLMAADLDLFNKVILSEDDFKRVMELKRKGMDYNEALSRVKGQKAQLASEKLLSIIKESGRYISPEIIKLKTDLSNIDYNRVIEAYNKSFAKSKMGVARIYSTPGVKMVFQGDESSSETPFRFFRQFGKEYPEIWLHNEKGYDTGEEAFRISNLENNENRSKGYENLIYDLNLLNSNNSSLSEGNFVVSDTIKHPVSKVIGTHTISSLNNDEIYSVTNFGNNFYEKYDIQFPDGVWREVINTDDSKYEGSGKYLNNGRLYQRGENGNYVSIKMAPYSTIIFEKVK